MANKNWIKSPWSISIGTAIFTFLLTIGNDYLKSVPVLSTISKFIKFIWLFIISILNFEIKVWWLLITILLFIGIMYILIRIKKADTFKPDFFNYKKDTFKRWNWSWDWKWSNTKSAWIIIELKAHCPQCQTPMIEHTNFHGFSFDCPRCEFRAEDHECDQSYKIESVILDNINRKQFNK